MNDGASTPAAVYWYRAYCLLIVGMHVLGMFEGMGLRSATPEKFQIQLDDRVAYEQFQTAMNIAGLTLIYAAIIFGALNLATIFFPRKKWTYQLCYANIVLGICVCFPVCIPLWIAWAKPRVREYYEA